MLELLKEERQLVKRAEIPQNSELDVFKIVWKMDKMQKCPQI